MTIKRSILLIQKGEYKKAEQMLHVALRQAQSIQSYDGVTYVYDVMANLAFEVGDIKKSKKLFTSVMQRLLSTGTMENDVKIIHMSLKMAKLCESSGEPEKAEDGYLFCLKHIQDHAKLTPDDEDILILWAMTLDWYAKMLLSQSRLSEALDYYLEAYQLCLKVNGKQHQQTVVLLNDLGTTYCLLGQHDQALDYLFEAIEIGKQIPDMQDLSSIYVNLGNVYLKKSMHNEAKQNCTKALTLSKKNNDDETKIQANYCLDEVNKLLK
ncbi:tetratricopeptide repeat protein 19 homolog, mitochondrial isoform X2 [Aphidius gifuensis]|nr:tetratricopeptide repeat protein 19 homolog, mitochondrial isoform X2 [Aphidius gifuensis]